MKFEMAETAVQPLSKTDTKRQGPLLQKLPDPGGSVYELQ